MKPKILIPLGFAALSPTYTIAFTTAPCARVGREETKNDKKHGFTPLILAFSRREKELTINTEYLLSLII